MSQQKEKQKQKENKLTSINISVEAKEYMDSLRKKNETDSDVMIRLFRRAGRAERSKTGKK